MDGERLQTQLLCSDTVRPCTEVASQQCDTVEEEECQDLPGYGQGYGAPTRSVAYLVDL